MKAVLLFGVAALSALVVAVGLSAPRGERVISVISTPRTTDARDRPPKGGSKGDVVAGTSVLRNAVNQFGRARGAVVGRDRYRMTFQSPTVVRVEVTATLPGGTIRCRGSLDTRRGRVSMAVVGGTGDFAGATGACEASEHGGRATSNVYRLRLPTAA